MSRYHSEDHNEFLDDYEDDYYDFDDGYSDEDDDFPVLTRSQISEPINGTNNNNQFGGNTQDSFPSWRYEKEPTRPKRSRNTIVRHGNKAVKKEDEKKDPVFVVDDYKNAAIQNKVDVLEMCLKQGIEVDTIFPSGWTALMYAAHGANAKALKFLLQHEANPNFHKDLYSVLMAACCSKSEGESDILKCVEGLIEKGAEVNSFDRFHMSPLIYAAKEGRTLVIKKLVEAKADLNKQDSKGYTGMIWAVRMDNLRVVHTLLELGADANKQTTDGYKALDFAVMQTNQQIQDLLKASTDSSRKKLILTEKDLQEAEQKEKASKSDEIITYGELELFLTGLELGNLISLFRDQHVNFANFLRMNDSDFQKMGISQFGIRKRLLDAIKQTHKKEWLDTSLPNINRTKRISCAEGIAIISNIKKHISLIGSTIGYVNDELKADKNILASSQEGAATEQMILFTEEGITNTRLLFDELISLRTHLAEVKDDRDYLPPDIIMPKDIIPTKKRWSTRKLLFCLSICGLVLWKNEMVLSAASNLYNAIKDFKSA